VVEDLKRRAALTWDVPVDKVAWENGSAVCLDAAKPDTKPLSLADIAGHAGRTGGPISAEVSLNAQGAGPGFGVHLCDVEIDPRPATSPSCAYTAAQDVGKAIHPAYVEGQIQGGVAQGVGWALNEEYIFDSKGRWRTPASWTTACRWPRTCR